MSLPAEARCGIAELSLVHKVPCFVDALVDLGSTNDIGEAGEQLVIPGLQLSADHVCDLAEWSYGRHLEEVFVQAIRSCFDLASEGDNIVPVEANTLRQRLPQVCAHLGPLQTVQASCLLALHDRRHREAFPP